LLRPLFGKEEVKSLVRMGGKMTPGGSNLRGARTMDQGKSKIAERSENLRSGPGAQVRPIFSKGDIAHVMRGVLNAPMTSHEGE
jgi:hypothetical protein